MTPRLVLITARAARDLAEQDLSKAETDVR